ncbi:MAG: autotransporter-associated beta strand repeat-containing protein, partial [Prosthecobacter sp.]
MKNIHPKRDLSQQMMNTMRTRLRVPVTVVMLVSTLTFPLQSQGVVLIKTNSGANTLLAVPTLFPVTSYAQNQVPTAADTILFNNTINAATTFRVSNFANGVLNVGGLTLTNPGGAITIQNSDNQNQFINLGASGIDMSRATQNLTISNATGGAVALNLLNTGAGTWSVAAGRTLTVNSVISGAGTGLTINPGVNGFGGIVALGAVNTFTGATSVTGSQLTLDYATAGNRIDSASSLTLNRSTILVQGAVTNTQNVAGLNLGAGFSQITRGGTTASINVGTINRTSPTGVLNVGAAGFVTTSTANAATGGILGGWAVVNNTDWATGGGTIAALAGASYTTVAAGPWAGSATTATNANITGDITAVSGNASTLKFNHATATTAMAFTLTGTLNVANGGILRNQNATTAINGGTLTAGGTANGTADSLYIWNNANTMTIASVIANNGGDLVNLVKAGASEVVLTGANTYGGSTSVADGRLTVGNGGTIGAINTSGNIELYGNSGVDNTGSLRWNRSDAVTLTGNITGAAGNDALRYAFQKLGAGIMTLTPSVANTYTGGTLITAGSIQAGNSQALSANSRYELANTAGVTLNLNGFSNTARALSGGGTTGGNVSLGAGVLTLNSLPIDAFSYGGVISGTGGLVKNGEGTQVLTANQTFTGPLSVNNGILRTASLATTAVTVNGGTLFAALPSASVTVNGTGAAVLNAGVSLPGNASVSLNGNGALFQVNNGSSYTLGAFVSAANSRLALEAGASNTTLTFNDTGSLNLNGVIGMSSPSGTGVGNVVKAGSASWALSGGNAYTGSTSINAGSVQIAGGATVEVLPDRTAVSLASGTILDLNGRAEMIGSLGGLGSVSLGSGVLTTGRNGISSSFGGVLSGGGALTKIGNGTMTLTGSNIFTGPLTVAGGSVVLDRVGGNTLADGANVALTGGGLVVNTSDTINRLTATRNSVISLASGATLTTNHTVAASVTRSAKSTTLTRVVAIPGGTQGLIVGMGVSGEDTLNQVLPAGTYIVQILNQNQVLLNTSPIRSETSNLVFASVDKVAGFTGAG